MSTWPNRSFTGGELAPSLAARVDHSKYQSGLKTCRNFIVQRHGGVVNRPGTRLVGLSSNANKAGRLVPFEFDSNQTYVLEFGHRNFRVIKDGAYVLGRFIGGSRTRTITNISRSGDELTVTSVNHRIPNGTHIIISDVVGTTQVNERMFIARYVSSSRFKLVNMDRRTVSSVGHDAYTSGGTVHLVLKVDHPWTENQLPALQFSQSADVVVVTHKARYPRTITRLAEDNWTVDRFEMGSSIITPRSAVSDSYTGASDTAVIHKYKVAYVSASGEESLPSAELEVKAFPHIKNAICKSLDTWSARSPLTLDGSYTSGGEYVNTASPILPTTVARFLTMTSGIGLSTTTFTIVGEDENSTPATEDLLGPNWGYIATSATAWSKITSITPDAPAGTDPSTNLKIGLGAELWNKVRVGASVGFGTAEQVAAVRSVNVYRYYNGAYGLVASAIPEHNVPNQVEAVFADDYMAVPDMTTTPTFETEPFPLASETTSGLKTFPGVVGRYQQRLVFASSYNDPEGIWMSRIGSQTNFNSSTPIRDDDSFSFRISGDSLNQVKHVVGANKMVTLTENGEWVISGGEGGAAITPATVNPQSQTSHGSGTLRPLVIGGTVLYVQASGSIVRDLGYEFQADGYRGTDLTIYSSHLFENYTLDDWAYQESPNSTVWCVRSDGALLGMTYIKEHELFAWHRHNLTGGSVEAICSVKEGVEDAIYMIVNRTIDGNTARYVERLDNRWESDYTDVAFVDSALSYDGTQTDSYVYANGSAGDVDFTIDTKNFDLSLYDGRKLEVYDSSGEVAMRLTIDGTGVSSVVVDADTTIYTGTVASDRDLTSATSQVQLTNYALMTDTVAGLWHLEGEEVSATGDSYVAANPNNDMMDVVTVEYGTATLSKPYAKITIGLPITCDLETLSVDYPDGETMLDKKKLITRVALLVESSRGIWVGNELPEDDGLGDLTEVKQREIEGYDDAVAVKTGYAYAVINGSWEYNGHVAVRHSAPLPLSVLTIAPAGLYSRKFTNG